MQICKLTQFGEDLKRPLHFFKKTNPSNPKSLIWFPKVRHVRRLKGRAVTQKLIAHKTSSLIDCVTQIVNIHCSRNQIIQHQMRTCRVDFSFGFAIYLDWGFHFKDECYILVAYVFIQVPDTGLS